MTDTIRPDTCGDVHTNLMRGITARCILAPPRRYRGHIITHTGPHWGPIDGTDTLIEWPREEVVPCAAP